jgi:hypothetical protein
MAPPSWTAEQRGVEQSIDAVGSRLADCGRKAFAARHDHIGAEGAHQLLIVGLGVGDHAQATCLGQCDYIGGQQSRAATDGEALTRPKTEQLQPEAGGEAVHRQRGGLRQRGAVGNRHHRRRRHDDQLGLGATLGPAGAQRGHNLLADTKALHALANGLDGAGGIHARHPGRLQIVAGAALAQADIGGVDRRGSD